jgi:twitching motility protein PilT
MAVIDTFLKLLIVQRAEKLVLIPDEIPTVVKGDESIELPMPAVPVDLVKRLSVEVVGEPVTGHSLEGTYCTADGEEFTYAVRCNESDCRIELQAVETEVHHEGEGPDLSTVAKQDAPPPIPTQPSRGDPFPPPEGPSLSPTLGLAASEHRPSSGILLALEQALQADASDIFLSSGKPPQLRRVGIIASLESAPTTDDQILQLIPREDYTRKLEQSGSVDFGIRWKLSEGSRRFRINVFRHSRGLAAAIRPIRNRIPSFTELNLPRDLQALGAYASGLVLVTGASGSGKSTTLAAVVDHINRTAARHIITIEDPIEFEHENDKSLIHQREVGESVESFSSGLRDALRENPDVILLGEMRDLATISAALTAAETGHLVLSTLHTGSATSAMNRIVDVFPGHQQTHIRTQLASSLRAVVSQRLVPSIRHNERLPALEKLIVTPAVANTIREGKEHHMRSAMQTGAEEGMVTLERSLAALECRGQISRETAFRHAHDQQALQKLFE